MGSYNAKPSTSDEKDHSVQPTTASKQTDFNNSHPFTIEDTSDTDGDETLSKNSIKKSPSPPPVKQIPKSSEAVMQDEQCQRELAQERHREETRAPSSSSGESASPYGLYNPLVASNGGRPYPPASASPAVTGSGMNPGSLPLLQYPGQSAPPLVALNPTSSAVFAPYPSAFTSPAAAVYTAGLHSSAATPRPYHGIESYSAMLASMGSQAQQHLQGHLIPAPSYFQGGYIPAQYNPLSPLMAGVIPASKGMFPEGSYLPAAVGPHVLTGILPSGHLVPPPAGQHPEGPGEDRGRSSPEEHYSASSRYLEVREQQILESRRLAEMQQLSPGSQVHRSIPEARVSPFQQVAYRVAMPEAGERLEVKGSSPGSLQAKSVHISSSKDVMLHCSTPKQILGGGDVDSSRQVQLALLPNTFYCGSVPGQTMVATTEGTIRVELPPPTVGINIGPKHGQPMPNPGIPMSSLPITSSNSGGSIFTFPGSSGGLPPLTSMPSIIAAAPTAVPYQAATSSRHHSPTYSATVAGLQSWHLTPQVRPTPSVRFQSPSLSPGMVAGPHQDGDQPMSGATDVHHHHPPGHPETTRTSPSTQHHPSPHQLHPHHQHPHHHHPHHHHHQRHPKGGNPAPTASPVSGPPPLHQPTNTLPSYFTRGSIIQLANSVLKRVEDLTTDDFVQSAGSTEGLKIDSSTVLRIDEEPHRGLALIGFLVGEHKAQVTVEAPYEHPFFVFGQGWSSVRPELSLKCYGLQCHTLAVGDVCVSLTVIENGKQGLKEDSEAEKHHARMQVQGMSSPEMKRRRMEEKLQKPGDHHHHAPPPVQGLTPSGSSHSSPSPGQQQQMEHQVHPGGGPYEVPDHGIDKNSNIVPDKPLEMPHMKLMRPPKRRWSDPIKANQEAAAAAAAAAAAEKQHGQQHPVAPETLGKVQQQQQQ